MGLLSGKRILVAGIANERSIAYGAARAMRREGADLAITYQNERLRGRVKRIADDLGSDILLKCDVREDSDIESAFASLSRSWDRFDGLVHSIAHAPRSTFGSDYVENTTRIDFTSVHDVCSYSFVALARYCRNMLNPNSTLVTLTYIGSERVVSGYGVMGPAKASLESNVRYMADCLGSDLIRVNAVSSGPIGTLSAYGIRNFKQISSDCRSMIPSRKSVKIEDVGNVVMFLCSDLSSGITGETIHVDGGFHALAV